MATRAYRRNNRGQFAGSGGGTKVTYGKAGGFANAAFRSRVLATRGSTRPPTSAGQKASLGRSLGATAGARRGRSRSSFNARLKKVGTSVAVIGISGAVGTAAAAAANRSLISGAGIKPTAMPTRNVFNPNVVKGSVIR